MTDEERARYYEQQQQYRWKCEDFNQELARWIENRKPRILNIESLNP